MWVHVDVHVCVSRMFHPWLVKAQQQSCGYRMMTVCATQHTLPEDPPRTSHVPPLTVRFPQPRSCVKVEFLLESVHRLRGLQGQKLQLLPSELRSFHSWHLLLPPAQVDTGGWDRSTAQERTSYSPQAGDSYPGSEGGCKTKQ